MKMNKYFNYRSDWFMPVLAVSITGHALFFGGAGFFNFSPKYAVVQAPSSVEIVMVPEKKEKMKIEDKIIVAKDVSKILERVVQKKIEEKEIQKPVLSPEVKGAVTEAKPDYLKNPAPVYPEFARQQGWEGAVILNVWVDKDGNVSKAKIERSSGYGILDSAALDAVKKWQFLPAKIGNLSFASKVRVPVRFILEEEK